MESIKILNTMADGRKEAFFFSLHNEILPPDRETERVALLSNTSAPARYIPR